MDKATCGAVALTVMWALVLDSGRELRGEVVEFTDKEEWMEAVGEVATIDFTGLANGTFLTDEFAKFGVEFTPDQNVIFESSLWLDGVGVLGAGDFPVSFTLSEPRNWVAVEYPGYMQFQLFLGDELVCESEWFVSPYVDIDFGGVVSTEEFDKVVILDPLLVDIGIDNLYVDVGRDQADVNADGVVDAMDLVAVVLAWGTSDPAADVNGDGVVNIQDLLEVVTNWS